MYDEAQGIGANTLQSRGNHSMFAKARLLPGATFAEADVSTASPRSTSVGALRSE